MAIPFSQHTYFGTLWLVRLVLQRGMAAIYLVAFLTVKLQAKPLLGEHGLLPIPAYLRQTSFRTAPSLFHWHYSDRLLDLVAWAGVALATSALFGLTDAGPLWLSLTAWLLLYVLYLSIANVGQVFFGFGWESMLLEAGFFTAFLGPSHLQPSLIPVLILRWMFFRTELGAGLIKLRHDPCWRDLTCLYYHYETQPLPNPLSWHFHHLPKPIHRFGILFSHFLQVIAPLGLFAPQPYASVAAALCITQQLWLLVSGNYSWLNWLTAVLGVAGFSDEILAAVLPLHAHTLTPAPFWFTLLLFLVGGATVLLSIQPVLNLLSPDQAMNASYNSLRLVNIYGAFGSVTKERHELILEGTLDQVLSPATVWREYAFQGKPGNPLRTPPQIAPYHLRLDWMIWFLPFTVHVTSRGVQVRGYDLWFLRFLQRLLANDPEILALMGPNPFQQTPPAHLRVLFYRYRFTDRATRAATGTWWTRELLGTYLDPVSSDKLSHYL